MVNLKSGLAEAWNIPVYSADLTNLSEVNALVFNGISIYVGGSFDGADNLVRGALVAIAAPDNIFQDGFE